MIAAILRDLWFAALVEQSEEFGKGCAVTIRLIRDGEKGGKGAWRC